MKIGKKIISSAAAVWRRPGKGAVTAVFVMCVASMLNSAGFSLPLFQIRNYGVVAERAPWLERLCASYGWGLIDLAESGLLGMIRVTLLCTATLLFFRWGWCVIRRSVAGRAKGWALCLLWTGSCTIAWYCYRGAMLSLLFVRDPEMADELRRGLGMAADSGLFFMLAFAMAAAVGALLPVLLARSGRALFCVMSGLLAVGVFAIGSLALSTRFHGLGVVAFVIAVVEYVRSLSADEKMSAGWHWPAVAVLAISVATSACYGVLLRSVDKSPYSSEIRLGSEVVDRSLCMDVRSSVYDRWCLRTPLPLSPEKADDVLRSVCSDSAVEGMDYPDVAESKMLSRYRELLPKVEDRGTNVQALVLASALRMRNFGVTLSGLPLNFAKRNKITNPSLCAEMNLLSILAESAKMDLSAWVDGLLALMSAAEHENYYVSYHWEEHVCLTGLRRLLMRHSAQLTEADVLRIRDAIKARRRTFARKRIAMSACVAWNHVHAVENQVEGKVGMPILLWDNRPCTVLPAYFLNRLFSSRIKALVKEWELAESERRLPDFGRPALSIEESVTTIADAYSAIDLALAVEQYRRKNGKLPASLKSLAPAYIESVPECVTDGSPFGYEKGMLACLPEERCPDELTKYRRVDAAGRIVSDFPGFRISFKYAHPEEAGPFHFSVPVLMR